MITGHGLEARMIETSAAEESGLLQEVAMMIPYTYSCTRTEQGFLPDNNTLALDSQLQKISELVRRAALPRGFKNSFFRLPWGEL